MKKITLADRRAGRRYRLVRFPRREAVGDTVEKWKAVAHDLAYWHEGRGHPGVGTLEFASERHDERSQVDPQLKSVPLDSHGGGEFRFYLSEIGGDLRFHPFPRLLQEEDAFLSDRERIAGVVSETRRAVLEVIAKHPAATVPATIAAIGYADGRGDMPSVCVELWFLGPDLAMGVERLPRFFSTIRCRT